MTIEAKLGGLEFLALDEESLKRYDISTGSQVPLLKVVEEMVCH